MGSRCRRRRMVSEGLSSPAWCLALPGLWVMGISTEALEVYLSLVGLVYLSLVGLEYLSLVGLVYLSLVGLVYLSLVGLVYLSFTGLASLSLKGLALVGLRPLAGEAAFLSFRGLLCRSLGRGLLPTLPSFSPALLALVRSISRATLGSIPTPPHFSSLHLTSPHFSSYCLLP